MITLNQHKGRITRVINKAPGGKEYVIEGFLEPGVVSYMDSDAGICYLSNESINRMLPSIVGVPVCIDHQDINKENSGDQKKGEVTRAWYNEKTGRFDCAIVTDDPDVEEKIKNGWSASCAYNVTDVGPGGEWHAIPYHESIENGVFEHMAIVENPRYEDCAIRMNSKDAKMVKANLKSYDKPERGRTAEFECLECGATFRKSLKGAVEMECPKCHGYDIEVANSKKNATVTCPECGLKHPEEYIHACPSKEDRENAVDRSKWTAEFKAKFEKEKSEHPEFKDEDIMKIVIDHAKEKNKSMEGDPFMNALPVRQLMELVEKITTTIPAGSLNEQACIKIAKDSGQSDVEGRRAWEYINGELEALNGKKETYEVVEEKTGAVLAQDLSESQARIYKQQRESGGKGRFIVRKENDKITLKHSVEEKYEDRLIRIAKDKFGKRFSDLDNDQMVQVEKEANLKKNVMIDGVDLKKKSTKELYDIAARLAEATRTSSGGSFTKNQQEWLRAIDKELASRNNSKIVLRKTE